MNSQSIKVLIVDDEPFARKYIREMLRDERDIEIIGEAGNGKVAARMIGKQRPDLMFLDIQMPEMDGFSLLQSLNEDELPTVVFTTAFEEFAIQAFEVHAIDYLLKPFDQPRFFQSLEHARRRLAEPRNRKPESEQITELLRAISNPPKYIDRLLVKKDGRIIFLKTENINWIKADDKYVHLHVESSRHMIRQTLTSLKRQLDPAQFVQLNRSVIVNVDSIKELHTMFNGEHEVQIHDGTTFTLSRAHKIELFDRLGRPVR